MLKLSKYELRKNRNVLLFTIGGLLLLELYFLVCVLTKHEDNTMTATVLLIVYAIACFFVVLVMAIANYSRELSAKTSYLVFLTPNTSLSIILSKLLTALLSGCALAALIGGLAVADAIVLQNTFPELSFYFSSFYNFINSFGFDLWGTLLNMLLSVVSFLLGFFSIVAIAYLSVTLSATFLQNHKAKGLISIAFFLIITYLYTKADTLLPGIYNQGPKTMGEVFISSIPALILTALVIVGCVFGCAKLLDKKVSL